MQPGWDARIIRIGDQHVPAMTGWSSDGLAAHPGHFAREAWPENVIGGILRANSAGSSRVDGRDEVSINSLPSGAVYCRLLPAPRAANLQRSPDQKNSPLFTLQQNALKTHLARASHIAPLTAHLRSLTGLEGPIPKHCPGALAALTSSWHSGLLNKRRTLFFLSFFLSGSEIPETNHPVIFSMKDLLSERVVIGVPAHPYHVPCTLANTNLPMPAYCTKLARETCSCWYKCCPYASGTTPQYVEALCNTALFKFEIFLGFVV